MNEEFEKQQNEEESFESYFHSSENSPVIDDDYVVEDERPKKRVRLFARTVAALLAVALVSFSSIQIYKNMPTGNGENKPSGDSDKAQYTATFDVADPDTEALSTESIAERVRPSIVTVVCQVQTSSGGFGGQSTTQTATGSGIIISADGFVVTNYHVIEGSISVEVYLGDGTKYVGAIVGGDALSDLAVLKLDASGLPAAEFGNSDLLKVGEKAVAIGNPLGIEFAGTTTQGIISGLDREIEVGGVAMTLIQTDATINPGNSGGALVNKYGQVIGVTSSKISIDYAEGIAFAIPSNDAIKVVNDLINLGYVAGRPYIGLSGEAVTYYMQAYYRVPQGVYITEVVKDSPADKAGLVAGDIITEVDGVAVSTVAALNNIKNNKNIGDTIKLRVFSANNYKEIELTLVEYIGQ